MDKQAADMETLEKQYEALYWKYLTALKKIKQLSKELAEKKDV
jgi:hypothetical protein